jgi:hypothetical protein
MMRRIDSAKGSAAQRRFLPPLRRLSRHLNVAKTHDLTGRAG